MSNSRTAGASSSRAAAGDDRTNREAFNNALRSKAPNNAYISHLRVLETDGEASGKPKARYLITAVDRDTGRVTLNKARRNANLTYSIGKEWDLNLLQAVEVHSPTSFTLTLSRPYPYNSDRAAEQEAFLQMVVNVYRKYTGDTAGPTLVGLTPQQSSSRSSAAMRPVEAPVSAEPVPEPQPTAAPEEDDDIYGGAVLGDSVQAPAPARVATPPRPTEAPISRGSPASVRNTVDPNAFPSPKPRNDSFGPRRMGSSASLANDARSPRRSESIPDFNKTSGRRPSTPGSQNSESKSRNAERTALTRSPSVPSVRDLGWQVTPDPASAPEIPPAVPAIPSITETPAPKQKPPQPLNPPRPVRTLSKILPLDGDEDGDDDEDTTLAYVEEMLEGFEWRPLSGETGWAPGVGKRRRLARTGEAGNAVASHGTADVIEARLLKELSALEEANIHGMVESDERVGLVIKHMEDALAQLDVMEGMIMRYKMQLNGRDEDINHIESQNGALQIHTSNQQKLAAEVERLLDTIHVDEGSIYTLKHASLESRSGIEELERAAGELYKSIVQATSSATESVSAATERLDDYRALSERFCKRVFDHVNLTLTAETASYLSDPQRQNALSSSRHPGPSLQNHAHLEELLGRYCGLVLYMKETSPGYFARLSSAYYASVSECWRHDMVLFLTGWKKRIKRGTGDDYGWEVGGDSSVANGPDGGRHGYEGKGSGELGAFGRAATIRKVVRGEKSKNAKVQDEGDMPAAEVFQKILDSLTPLIQGEQAFIGDFLQINNSNVTFADYLDMEPYFRRRAAQLFGFGTSNASQGGGSMREMKGALELVFGFLASEWDSLVDHVVHMDKSQIIPILGILDRAINDAEDVGSDYLARALSRAHTRLSTILEKIEDEHPAEGGAAGATSAAGTQGKAAGEKKKKR
ncbi:hypothetical protein OC845_005868, partial [Tilletia horrida]